MDEAVVCFFLTDDEKSSRIEKSVSYHFKLIIMFRIYQSMFCHENNHESDWSDSLVVTIEEDNQPPRLYISKPDNALYIMNVMVRKYLLRNPFIIGKINIEVNASDKESGINRVEFHIDNELKVNDNSAPYIYTWTRDNIVILRHRYIITIVAFDNAGNSASDEILVWRFL